MSDEHRERLRNIRRFDQLVAYLYDDLKWPIETDDFEDLTFDYEAEDLGLDFKTAAKITQIKQLRPLVTNQPWGIFFVQFAPKRLPVVALRRILGRLVIKKRTAANTSELASWQLNDLMFISSYGTGDNRQISLAHFSENEQFGDLPTLRVLGWDGNDRDLKLDHVHNELQTKLCWPEDDTDFNTWREQWSSVFTLRNREEITTSQQLAVRLADLASSIRRKVNAALAVETEHGPMRNLMKAFQEALIHDLKADDFADMYAQTIAYGLLSARVSRQSGALVVDDVALMVPITSPFLRELMETFLHLGGRKQKGSVSAAIDFDELGINDVVEMLRRAKMDAVLRDFDNRYPQEDPVLHFYELFLKEYDAKKRLRRGVFYTPKPVVRYIVRSVHELLQQEFALEDGLADTATWQQMRDHHPEISIPKGVSPDQPFVQILDPATGTATFLVEVMNVIHETLTTKWKKQSLTGAQQRDAWNEYVPKHLLPRLHGYELMIAPYAIAHMKIGLKLYETGYRFGSDERARVYLTNTLEPPQDFSDRLAFDVPALAHEAQAVNADKRQQRFTLVIGNPPYSLVSANMEPGHRLLVERYKFIGTERIRERGALQLEKILNDDYVKFIAKSQDYITSAGTGVLGIITNHAYLDNPTMRALRHSFLASFKFGCFYNLGGSAKKLGENEDENVFDIQQGVAICVVLKHDMETKQHYNYARLLGDREAKYRTLGGSTIRDTEWSKLSPTSPYYLFVPTDYGRRSEYEQFVLISEVFPLHSIGFFTSKDHFVISREPQKLVANAIAFRDSRLTDNELCQSFEINPKKSWNVSRSREQIRQLSDSDISKNILQFTHRPFDTKYIFYHRSLVWSLANPVNRNLVSCRNLALVTSRQLAMPPWAHIFW